MAITAIPVGFVAGLFGIGGGLITVPFLYYIFGSLGIDQSYIMHLAVGTSFAIIIPTSTVSVLTHHKFKAVDFDIVKSYGIYVITGVILGTAFAASLKTKSLVLFFSVVIFLLGIYLLLLKEKENNGFSYEAASASLELLFKKEKKLIQSPFNLIGYDVRLQTSESNKNNQCSASIKLSVEGNEIEEKSIGNGPVAALDKALREALLKFYPLVNKVKLTDYKVRVVNESEATESIVRVSIESADDKQVWTTVGASSNIIEASWMALSDSMEWWLTRNIIY